MSYKIGDKVRIIKRTGHSDDYPFSFTDIMTRCTGKVYEIENIDETSDSACKINGDFHLYHLKGTRYSWHSSMFELVEPKLYDLPEEESIKIIL